MTDEGLNSLLLDLSPLISVFLRSVTKRSLEVVIPQVLHAGARTNQFFYSGIFCYNLLLTS